MSNSGSGDAAENTKTIPGEQEVNPAELAQLAKDRFGFWQAKRAQYGPVFYFNLFNRPTIILNGPQAWQVYSDPALVTRVEAALPALKLLFGGANIGLLDGIEHKERKAQVMAAFSHEALASYLAGIEQTVERNLADWTALGQFSFVEKLKDLGFALLCESVLGLEAGERRTTLQQAYATMIRGLVDPSAFPQARQSLERIFAILDEIIQEHHDQPGREDGLSRIIAAASQSEAAHRLSDEQIRFELHHLFFAGSGLYAFLVNLILRLEQHPQALATLRQELAEKLGTETGTGAAQPLTLEKLAELSYLQEVVLEVKRLSPIITLVGGRAVQDFEFAGHVIPANSFLGLPAYTANLDQEIYTEPAEFDPERFSKGRAEQNRHPYAFAPQGAGAHGCAGYDYTSYVTQVFAVVLLRGYQWILPAQNLELNWASQVPEPTDGLQGRLVATTQPQ